MKVIRPDWNIGSLLRREWRDHAHVYHRVSGPAIEYVDGSKEWWSRGVRLCFEFGNYSRQHDTRVSVLGHDLLIPGYQEVAP